MTNTNTTPAGEYPARTRTDYGLRFDCEKNGCAEPCLPVADVMPRGNQQPVVERVNGHAVTAVERTVTYSEWSAVEQTPLTHGERRTYQALRSRGFSHEDALSDALDGVDVHDVRAARKRSVGGES